MRPTIRSLGLLLLSLAVLAFAVLADELPYPIWIYGDTNRSGDLDGDDACGAGDWTIYRGAYFTINCDRDDHSRNLKVSQRDHAKAYLKPIPDAVAYSEDGEPNNEDLHIKGGDDDLDIAPLRILVAGPPEGFPDAWKIELEAESLEDLKVVHIYPEIKNHEKCIWGGLNETEKTKDIKQYLKPNIPSDFGVEGLVLKGMKRADGALFDGDLILTLKVTDENGNQSQRRVKMKVAPWLMIPATRPADELCVADYGPNGENREFLAGLSAVSVLRTIAPQEADGLGCPKKEYLVKQWTKDHVEIGFYQRPGGPKNLIAFCLPYYSPPHPEDPESKPIPQPLWPNYRLNGPNLGFFLIGKELGGKTADFGGNLALLPPNSDHMLGRIMVGDNCSNNLWDFLCAQDVQEPFKLTSTKWLSVGHVDEIFGFTDVANEVLVADPDKAYQLMQAYLDAIPVPKDRGSAVFFATGANNPVSGDVRPPQAGDDNHVLRIDRNIGGQAWWKYVRIYEGPGAGQVARISAWGNGFLRVDKVWNTTSLIMDGGKNQTSCIAHYMQVEAPTSEDGGWVPLMLPGNGSRYVLVEDTKFWPDIDEDRKIITYEATPAFVTVVEMLADMNFSDFNAQAQQAINQARASLTAAAGANNPPAFLEVPVLFVGSLGVPFDTQAEATAFTPNLANAQALAGGLIAFPAQFSPGGLFETDEAIGKPFKVFIDDWRLYHVFMGEVHCGSAPIRPPSDDPWWWFLW